MKTWKAVLLNVALIFGSVFVGKIKDPEIQAATAASVAALAATAAKLNGDSDQDGNPLPPAQPKQ